MSSSRHFLVGVVACALLVVGCGDGKKAPPSATATGSGSPASVEAQVVPGAMLDLLPEGTVGVVYVRSVQGLQEGIERLAAASGAKKGGAMDLAQFAGMIGADIGDFDISRSAALAMTLSADSPEPRMTAILPVRDEKGIAAKVKQGNPGATVETAGGFAAVTQEGAYKRAGPPPQLRAPLPAGDLVIRLDVASLWKTFGPMVSSQADQMIEGVAGMSPGGPDPTATLKPMLDGFKSMLDAASVLDLAFRIDGTAVEADVTVRFADRARAPLLDLFAKTDLASLARSVPSEGMFSIAASMNPEKMWSAFQPLMKASLEVYPEADRAAFQQAFDSAAGLMKAMGNGMVMSAGLGAGGLEGVGAVEVADAAAYMKTFGEMAAKMGGMKASFMSVMPLEERVVDGTKVSTMRVKIDSEKLPAPAGAAGVPDQREMMATLFGKDSMTYNIFPAGNRVVFAMGSDEPLKRAIQAAKAGPAAPLGALSTALAAAGSDTVAYVRYDLSEVMRLAGDLMGAGPDKAKPKPAPPAGEPVVLTCVVNAGANDLRGRMSVDVGKLMKLVKGVAQPR
jgi:hypothetical protein